MESDESGEMAIRTAIGASRGRLMQHVLVESVLMSVIGGIAGVAAAYWVLHVRVSAAPVDLPRVSEIRIDPRVLTFALSVPVWCRMQSDNGQTRSPFASRLALGLATFGGS
jgi:ABC-type antimicrobial peptide transport system permease subunit